MILSKIAKVRTNSRIGKFYNNLGLDTSGEFIEVPIDLLTKGSHSIISCKCDFCGDEKQMSYKTYNRHIKFDGLYYCNKCCLIKKESTIFSKYGTKSYTQSEDFKYKSKKTCIEKYGHEFYQSSDEYKNKIIQTCIEKYACENVMQSREHFESQSKSSLKSKTHQPSNLKYQGSYELDFIEKYYNKVVIEKINPIQYQLNENTHYYHPDFYLPKYKLIVEVKSSYTYEYDLDKNLAKKEYSIKSGFNFIFIIDKNYSELESILLESTPDNQIISIC
jgi:hypothetical protein